MSDLSKMNGFSEYVKLCNKLEENNGNLIDSDLRIELMEYSVNILKQANEANKQPPTEALRLQNVSGCALELPKGNYYVEIKEEGKTDKPNVRYWWRKRFMKGLELVVKEHYR